MKEREPIEPVEESKPGRRRMPPDEVELTDEQFARMEDEYDELRRALHEGDEEWLREWEETQAFKEELRQWRRGGSQKADQ